MRMSFIVATIMAAAMSSQASAQRRDAPAEPPSQAVTAPPATNTDTTTDDAHEPRNRSGFGQVMALLTRLLQDAATREQQGAEPDAASVNDPASSAVTISVTPVTGRTSFFTPSRRTGAPAATRGVGDAGTAPALERNAALAVQPEPGGGS